MPHVSDLHTIHATGGGLLSGVGKSNITHRGSATYMFHDDCGHTISIEDTNVLVCPDLQH